MQCERSGEYKPPKTSKKPKLEGTNSRKCECLFRLKCFFEKNTQDWWLAMLCGIHNHELAPKLTGHLLAGRPKVEEKQRVIDMTKSLAAPRNILTNLKEKTKKMWQSSSKCTMHELDGARGKERTRQRCNTWHLKTYFFLIPSQLICLTLSPPFCSWTPLTKPIRTECRYLRLLVSPLPKWCIRLSLHFFPLNKTLTLLGHLRCWLVFWHQPSTCLRWLSLIGTPLCWMLLTKFSLKQTVYFAIFILRRMSKLSASRIVESKRSL